VSAEASGPPDFWVALPPDFRDLPLGGEEAAWTATAERFLSLARVDRPPAYQLQALRYLRAFAAALTATGVVKAVACLGRVEDRLTTAAVTLSWQPCTPEAPDVVAQALATALGRQANGRLVRPIELPCGPAVSVVDERVVRQRDEQGDAELTLRSIQVLVPTDRLPWLLALSLSTPCLPDWKTYSVIMAEVCRSLRFTPPAVERLELRL
jgi:hypothetical protein